MSSPPAIILSWPAPEAKTYPFGYKFSWGPLGVLQAAKNPAWYLWEGQQVYLPVDKLFDQPASLCVEGLGIFEGYPNRDSLSYLPVYGIPGARTVLCGTLRWPGWCWTFKRYPLEPAPARLQPLWRFAWQASSSRQGFLPDPYLLLAPLFVGEHRFH